MLSHYTKHNLTSTSQTVTAALFKTLAFMAEALTFAYLGVDFVLGIQWGELNLYQFHPMHIARVWFLLTLPYAWTRYFVGLTTAACFGARFLNVIPCSALLNLLARRRHRAQQRSYGCVSI